MSVNFNANEEMAYSLAFQRPDLSEKGPCLGDERSLPSLADHADGDLARVRAAAVFEEKDALPGAEGHAAVDDRDDLAGAGECHADVARHIVGSLERVNEPRRVFRHEFFEKHLQVAARRRVGIFHDHEARAGVAHEDRDRAVLNRRA